jgi:zinc transporter ZupT
MDPGLLTLPIALAFAAVHVLSARLSRFDTVPRSVWLSFGGGVSVAYVFLHVLPELAAHEARLRERGTALEAQVFAVALLGLVAFYGVERLARSARGGAGVFWIHVGSFAVYNALIGYLLHHREETDLKGLVLFAIALGLHFLVNDRGLATHHGALYARFGRWLVAGAVLAGFALGTVLEPLPEVVAGLFAFLAGGIVLNVLKEELPEERESRFLAFLVGAVGYAALLLVAA